MPTICNTTRSLMFLSLLCFALADVRDGLGPFLGVYLQGKGWSPDAVGYAMAAGGLATICCATPLGALADRVRKKRLLLGVAVLSIVATCALFFLGESAVSVWTARILQGACSAAIAPTLCAITLGLVGQKGLPIRLGKNEAWSHFGSCSTALLAGVVGFYHGIPGVFFVMVGLGALCVLCLGCITPRHINHDVARGLEPEQPGPVPARLLFTDFALLAIALTVALFSLGDTAMSPLLGQSAVARYGVDPAAYTGATVLIAQTTMIGAALWGAKLAVKRGYGVLFFLALTVLPVRGLVAGLYDSVWSLAPVQILDGIANGLMGVATPGIVARILRGSGHVNMGLGIVLTLKEIGAAMSNAYGGLFAHYASYSAAFLALAAMPCLGLLLFILAARKLPALRRAAASPVDKE